jgi:hypothetical protein
MSSRYVRGIKRGFGDYRWLLYYLQRLTLRPRLRQRAGALIARLLPHSHPFHPSAESRAIGKCLQQDGIVFMPGLLTPSEVNEIVCYLRTKNCYDPYHPEKPGFQDPQKLHSTCFNAYYTADDIAGAPHLLNVANHPTVLEAVEIVFGCKPTLSNIDCWWLLANYDYSDRQATYFRQYAQTLHRDVDDWSEIKLFIYLTDVEPHTAAHLFVKGSHRGQIAPGRRNVELEVVRRSHPEKLLTVTGPAGTAWLENSFGLHAGPRPKSDNRLILAFVYTLFPLPFRNTLDLAHVMDWAAQGELKTLMPEDAKEASGHGVRGRRSKSGAVSFGAQGKRLAANMGQAVYLGI